MRKTIAFALLLLGLGVGFAAAQSDNCPVQTDAILQTLDEFCDGLDRNQACYGASRVIASFVDVTNEPDFAGPGAVAALAELATLRTTPIDVESGVYGVAVMRVQANLPNTIPGQGALFMLVGDASVTNRVDPADALVLTDPLAATVSQGPANLRSGPGMTFNVLTSVPVGTPLGADARDAAGEWVRVVFNDLPMWIFADLLTLDGEVASLPVLDGARFGPMQAFTLTTGIGPTRCEDVPNTLLVQSPENIAIDLNINGVDVRVGSTAAFTAPSETQLRIGVLDGQATIFAEDEAGNIQEIVIPAGFVSRGDFGDDGVDAADEWEEPSIFGDDWLDIFDDFEAVDDELFNYELFVPEDPEELVEDEDDAFFDDEDDEFFDDEDDEFFDDEDDEFFDDDDDAFFDDEDDEFFDDDVGDDFEEDDFEDDDDDDFEDGGDDHDDGGDDDEDDGEDDD